MRMTRSAAAPAAAKTTSTMVGPPWCVETGGGGLPPPCEPLDDCSGGGRDGEWVLAGEIAEPRDLAGGGGGEEPLGSGGAGEDQATGGDGESADGRGAAEGAGLLFVGGDGAAGGLVEVLDDMARHETINLHKLSRPCGSLRCRGSGRGDERRRKPQPPRRRGSAPPPAPGHARRRAAAAGSGPARPVRAFHPGRRHLKIAGGEEEDPHSPCSACCPVPDSVAFC